MSNDVGVWYTLIGNNQNVEVDVTHRGSTTSSRNGIAVALFAGTACNNLKCLKSITDQSENPMVNLSWNATTGQQFYIFVAGTSGSTGSYSVSVEVCILRICIAFILFELISFLSTLF
jgi:large-conductance mechanosensitive channel